MLVPNEATDGRGFLKIPFQRRYSSKITGRSSFISAHLPCLCVTTYRIGWVFNRIRCHSRITEAGSRYGTEIILYAHRYNMYQYQSVAIPYRGGGGGNASWLGALKLEVSGHCIYWGPLSGRLCEHPCERRSKVGLHIVPIVSYFWSLFSFFIP